MRLNRPGLRSAYTLIELLTVVAIIGVLTAVSVPRLSRLRNQGQMSSATTRFTRAVFAARQASIQRGKHAYFKHNGNKIWVIVDYKAGPPAESVVVTPALNLETLYSVEVTAPAGLTSIDYDPRGVSAQATKQVFKFKHHSDLQDSLCISRLGNTIREKCP
jgi:prepilin-type N-terminal cleavage/methylation domain-containing protein